MINKIYNTVVVFGESENGLINKFHFLSSIEEAFKNLGKPNKNRYIKPCGLELTIKYILFRHNVYFFKINEEGENEKEYSLGLQKLSKIKIEKNINFIGLSLPGMVDKNILYKAKQICKEYKMPLIIQESDLQDLLNEFFYSIK